MKRFQSEIGNKRVTISNKTIRGKYIARRIFHYKTSFGENSCGYEKYYDDFNNAVAEESKWLKE